ncbi:MAG: transposase zinc-binding domain-containing protein [Acidobacteria bacterium]|nr:transposase zinc-binding domain-containing protein [Acidobacteriota bacterium]
MRVYDDRFQKEYGRWKSVIQRVVERYLACGILTGGFCRLKCDSSGEEKLPAFSCKRRGFCPSCSARRAVPWSQIIRAEVLQLVPRSRPIPCLPPSSRSRHSDSFEYPSPHSPTRETMDVRHPIHDRNASGRGPVPDLRTGLPGRREFIGDNSPEVATGRKGRRHTKTVSRIRKLDATAGRNEIR